MILHFTTDADADLVGISQFTLEHFGEEQWQDYKSACPVFSQVCKPIQSLEAINKDQAASAAARLSQPCRLLPAGRR